MIRLGSVVQVKAAPDHVGTVSRIIQHERLACIAIVEWPHGTSGMYSIAELRVLK